MQLNIMYLDDEHDLLETFFDTFTENDISIELFSEPEKALERLKQFTPDLLFLDLRLPGTSGDELAGLISKSIPKVLISGDLQIQPKNEFHQILRKPYEAYEVQNIIDHFKRIKFNF